MGTGLQRRVRQLDKVAWQVVLSKRLHVKRLLGQLESFETIITVPYIPELQCSDKMVVVVV